MDREEFETYLNANSRAVALFRSRALSYQHSQNRKRAASKRWSETVVASAVDGSGAKLKLSVDQSDCV